jgi:hypothetical protein
MLDTQYACRTGWLITTRPALLHPRKLASFCQSCIAVRCKDGTDLQGVLLSYHVPTEVVTNLDTGKIVSHRETFSVAGDDPEKAVRVSLNFSNVAVLGNEQPAAVHR